MTNYLVLWLERIQMFGRGKKQKEDKKKDQEQQEKPIRYYAKYLGGHKLFPMEEHSSLKIYRDRLEISLHHSKSDIRIPYSHVHMGNMAKSSRSHETKERMR
jgi:hypothetical protein